MKTRALAFRKHCTTSTSWQRSVNHKETTEEPLRTTTGTAESARFLEKLLKCRYRG